MRTHGQTESQTIMIDEATPFQHVGLSQNKVLCHSFLAYATFCTRTDILKYSLCDLIMLNQCKSALISNVNLIKVVHNNCKTIVFTNALPLSRGSGRWGSTPLNHCHRGLLHFS